MEKPPIAAAIDCPCRAAGISRQTAISLQEKLIAIVPARGGSKRLPGKNLLTVRGLPLLAHTIIQAKKSQLVEEVFISTDDDQIASVATRYGAQVIKRPVELADDRSSSESAVLHVLDVIENGGGKLPSATMMLQCTSPVRRVDDIDNAIRQFFAEDADSLLSGCFTKHFIWRRLADGAEPINYDLNNRIRSQDVEPQFQENGSIYITRTSLLRSTKNRMGGKISIYEMEFWSQFEIDQRDDLELIDWIMARAG